MWLIQRLLEKQDDACYKKLSNFLTPAVKITDISGEGRR